jgi:hypothetical protein
MTDGKRRYLAKVEWRHARAAYRANKNRATRDRQYAARKAYLAIVEGAGR